MPRTVLARRRPLVLTAALAVALALVVPPAAPTVALVGDLQSELGCPGD